MVLGTPWDASVFSVVSLLRQNGIRVLIANSTTDRDNLPRSLAAEAPRSPGRTLRRHHFSGASRLGRDGNLMSPNANTA